MRLYCSTLSSKKTVGISLKIDQATADRLESFEKVSGIDRSTLLRSSLNAGLDFFDVQGFIIFPIRVVDSNPVVYNQENQPALRLNEPAPDTENQK